MRAWLLTSTTYGSWLPGIARGSVTSVRDLRPGDRPRETRLEHDRPGDNWEDEISGLFQAAKSALKGPEVALDRRSAESVLLQFQETASYRGWELRAVSVMSNHFHAVVDVPRELDPTRLLGDLKAYATRRLNRELGRQPGGDWWTRDGSKRPLPDDRAIANAENYVLFKQSNPLVVWCRIRGRLV